MKKDNMKNKNGFTLIELLTIIIILSLVVSIVVLVSTSIIDRAKKNSYEVTVNNIENVASDYIIETQLPISWINKDVTDKEYVCIVVQDLIDTGYFKGDILDSYIDKNVKVNKNDFIYLERDSKTKTVEKEILLSHDINDYSEYINLCDKMDENGIINIMYEPIGWSKSKNIFIEYKLVNNINYLSDYTYGYKFNGNELVDIDNVFNSYVEKQNLTVNKNGTIYAQICDESDVKVSKSLDIVNIDNEGPVVSMGNYTGGDIVNNSVIIPFVVTDIGIGVDPNSFTINDLVVSVGDKVITDGMDLIKVNDNNYNLQINNNVDNGIIKIEIDDNKIFDMLDNPNEKIIIDTGIVFNNVYTISYDANGGSGAPENQIKKYGVALTLSNVIPVRNGYTFLGWSTLSTATKAAYDAGDSYTVNADAILYAVWFQSPLYSYKCANKIVGSSPYYLEYTGKCSVHDDGNGDWRVKFLTSGDLTLLGSTYVDVFLVGGGGGGGKFDSNRAWDDDDNGGLGAGGGGGGYTLTSFSNIKAGKKYSLLIGSGGAPGQSGKDTIGFGGIAYGGSSGTYNTGGTGGSGGGGGGYYEDETPDGESDKDYDAMNGGSNGSAGSINMIVRGSSGVGQEVITREFGESTGDLYAGGGGGGAGCEQKGIEYSSYGIGGAGGGGNGGNAKSTSTAKGKNGTANTGGGGGGGARGYSSGSGGSGIIVIRNSRKSYDRLPIVDFDFTYENGYYAINNDDNGNWRIKFLTNGTFRVTKNLSVDAFLVGGGGAGGFYNGKAGGGGGGGGYVTKSSVDLIANTNYVIGIGTGGKGGTTPSDGGTTTAFNLTAFGGKKGSSNVGGAGGSGGGGGGNDDVDDGGEGGQNGSNGRISTGGTGGIGGSGSGKTTYEFGDSSLKLYSGGGGGGGGSRADKYHTNYFSMLGVGGAGGGGYGGVHSTGSNAALNSGGGGGGSAFRYVGGNGGSGVVVIRNKR